MAQALFNVIKHEDQALCEMIGLAIGAYGFAHHLRHLNRPPLPLLLSLPLAPFSLMEALLKTLMLSSNGQNSS